MTDQNADMLARLERDGLGPIGGLDHSPDEYIERSSIVPRTTLLALLIMAITEDNSLVGNN
jgi:acetylornithine deacetylase/succinyl-diaminopimelate desuccinylase-like protein